MITAPALQTGENIKSRVNRRKQEKSEENRGKLEKIGEYRRIECKERTVGTIRIEEQENAVGNVVEHEDYNYENRRAVENRRK